MFGADNESGASHLGFAGAAFGAGRAPWSIHDVSIPISAAVSAGPPSGMRVAPDPVMRCTSRLPLLSPGRIAAPLRPPFSTSSYVASESPPDRFT
jgi:hypothetical protein